jgi:hypothetical protein
LVYRSRAVDLFGRRSETEDLLSFCISGQPCEWWTIIGDAGMGKSRLIFEFMIRLASAGWYTGFLSGKELKTFRWEHWRPVLNTLIAIDYAADHNADVVQLLKGFKEYKNENFPKIRILLIARDITGPWFSDLNYAQDNGEIKKSKINKPLAINGLADSEILMIIDSLTDAHKLQVTKTQMLQEIRKIDPSGSPLLAIIFAIEKNTGILSGSTNKYDLLALRLAREERSIWKKHITNNDLLIRFKLLVAYLTMIGGLQNEDISALLQANNDIFPGSQEDFTVLNLLGLAPENLNNVKGIQPHLVGEYFVAANFMIKPAFGFLPTEQFKKTIALAWKYKPAQLRSFISRFVLDFSEIDSDILMPFPPADSPVETLVEWCMLQPTVISAQMYSGKDVWTERLQQLSSLTDPIIKPVAQEALILSFNVMLEYTVSYGNPDDMFPFWNALIYTLSQDPQPSLVNDTCALCRRLISLSLSKLWIDIGKSLFDELLNLGNTYIGCNAFYFAKKVEPHLIFYTELDESLKTARMMDFNHEIMIGSATDLGKLKKEADALDLLIYEAVINEAGTGDAIVYLERLEAICEAADSYDFYIILGTALQNYLALVIKDRNQFDKYFDKFETLVSKEYHSEISHKWVLMADKYIGILLITDKPRAIAILGRLSLLHELRSTTQQVSNISWEVHRRVQEHHLANFDFSSATEVFRKIQKMEEMEKKFYDGVSLCHSALYMHFYCQQTGDSANEVFYLDIAERSGKKQYGTKMYKTQYTLARGFFSIKNRSAG